MPRLAPLQNPLVRVLAGAVVRHQAVRPLPGREKGTVHLSDGIGAHDIAQLVDPLSETLVRRSWKQGRRKPGKPIPRRERHAADACGHGPTDRPRDTIDTRQHPRAVDISVVAAKQLVATVAGQRDGDVLAGELRDEQCRQL